ncbi:MAG: tetratricopeptide repeat protein [Verrucomicrobiota bacterium]|jgi:TPR repeat protein
MRPYVRPLVVTFSAFGLACLFSYAAIALTEPSPVLPAGKANAGTDSAAKQNPELSPEASFAQAKLEAAGGDPEKLLALANCYLIGYGTERDPAEAARLHKLGAEKGDAFCQSRFGRDLLYGVGVKKDVAAGIIWLRKAADQNQPDAEYALHMLYEDDEEIKADLPEARKWLLRAAEHGHHGARADLAEEIINAKDQKRFKAVATWVRDGAMAGHDRSAHIMSFVYEEGLGTPVDPVESMAWRLIFLNVSDELEPKMFKADYEALTPEQQAQAEKRARELSGKREYQSPFARDPAELAAELKEFTETKARAEKGEAEAQHHLAYLLEEGLGTKPDATEAAKWCRKSAEQGYAEAQYSLAQTLRIGDEVAPDMKEAFQWYMKAAQQGHKEAEYSLSICYFRGDGVAVDLKESRRWSLIAAEHGVPGSQCHVGLDYYGEEPDPAKDTLAARWFRKAAEQLHPGGAFFLGRCYLNGRGVPKDRIEGAAWMFTCAKGMGEEHQDTLQKILMEFSEEEIKQADKRGREILAECRSKLKTEEEK